MQLYLIRHAEALPLGANGIDDDAQRPLADAGVFQSRQLATGLGRLAVHLDLVATSPLRRARQTAEEMLACWQGAPPRLHVCEELAPRVKPKQLARWLRNLAGEHVAVVGHQPDLGQFAAWLIGSNKVHIDFAKAGVACIHCDDDLRKGCGGLQWLVTPAWLGAGAAAPAEA